MRDSQMKTDRRAAGGATNTGSYGDGRVVSLPALPLRQLASDLGGRQPSESHTPCSNPRYLSNRVFRGDLAVVESGQDFLHGCRSPGTTSTRMPLRRRRPAAWGRTNRPVARTPAWMPIPGTMSTRTPLRRRRHAAWGRTNHPPAKTRASARPWGYHVPSNASTSQTPADPGYYVRTNASATQTPCGPP